MIDHIGIQIARLVAGTINNHILSCEGFGSDGTECDGCCPVCCAPCAALAWFRDTEIFDKTLGFWFQQWDGGTGWEWQLPDGRINWSEIEKHWTLTECHAEPDEARWTPEGSDVEP